MVVHWKMWKKFTLPRYKDYKESLYRNEDDDEDIGRPSSFKVVDEGRDTQKNKLNEESVSDKSDSEEDIEVMLKELKLKFPRKLQEKWRKEKIGWDTIRRVEILSQAGKATGKY